MKTPGRPRVKRFMAALAALILLSAGAVFLDAWVWSGKVISRERARVAEELDRLRRPLPDRPIYSSLRKTATDGT